MTNDNNNFNTASTIIDCLESTSINDEISMLQSAYVYLAAYPERGTEEEKYLLVITAQLLKDRRCKRLKKESQVAHICECAKWFMTVLDNADYDLFYSIAEPEKAIKTINRNPDIVMELVLSLVRNWDKVKNDTFVYRLMNELLITIPRVRSMKHMFK